MDSQNDTPLGFWGSESDEIIARQFPLHRACRDGDVATLSRLVAEATREQMLCEDRFYGWTPLHWSAYFGKVRDTAQYFIVPTLENSWCILKYVVRLPIP